MIEYKKVRRDVELKDRVAVVLGGAGGIGEATARMYAYKGAKIAIVDCKESVDAISQAVAKDYKVETLGVRCDVTSPASVEEAVRTIVEHFGEINILANLPGYVELESAEDIGIDVIEKQIQINAIGVFRITQLVGRQMIKQERGGEDCMCYLTGRFHCDQQTCGIHHEQGCLGGNDQGSSTGMDKIRHQCQWSRADCREYIHG